MAEEPGNLKGKEQKMEEGEKVREEKRNGEENRIEKGEKGEKREDKEKVGRPTKMQKLMRERSSSLTIGEFFMRRDKGRERRKRKRGKSRKFSRKAQR